MKSTLLAAAMAGILGSILLPGCFDSNVLVTPPSIGSNEIGNDEPPAPSSPVNPVVHPVNVSCLPASGATTYDVGPDKTYESLALVPWSQLHGGDVVRVFWKPTPYFEKVLLSASGSEGNPIIFCGVPGPAGDLPVLDGMNATTASDTDFYSAAYTEQLGVIYIGKRAGQAYTHVPAHWDIRNFELRNAQPAHQFVDKTGVLRAYSTGAAGIYIHRGRNIAIRNVSIHSNGNGFFANTGADSATFTQSILVEGSHIHGNGNAGSDRQHNVYTETAGITFQFNLFGPPREGATGSNLKDRSAGTVIRFNSFEGGAHILDLVDCENAAPALCSEPTYANTYVYGNIFVNPPGNQGTGTYHGATTPIHFGGDTGFSDRYRKDLHFFHNTFISISNKSGTGARWRTVLFQLNTAGQKAYAHNNILVSLPETAGSIASELSLVNAGAGNASFGVNWISPDWVPSATNGVFTGTITGTENFISGPGREPGLRSVVLGNVDAGLTPTSAAINRGEALPALLSDHPVLYEFDDRKLRSRPQDGAGDLGAFEYL